MSFSINNSRSFKTDVLPLDSTLSKGPDTGTTLGMSGAGFGHTPSAPKTEFSATLQRDGLNNAGVLTKLFDMFDQLISAMREMFSGKAEIANRLPHTDNAVIGKQDPGVQSVANAPTQSQVKGSSSSEAQSKSKLEEDSQPKDAAVAGTQSKERLPVGVLSRVISDVANQLKKNSSEDSHQAETHAPGLRVLSRAREPGINVTSESNPQIKVEVNVNHCHCPETSIEAGKDSRVIAAVTSRTHAPVPPDKQVPTESVEGHVKSVVTEGKDATRGTEVKESHVEPVKADGKDGKAAEHDSDHITGLHPHHHEVAEPVTSDSRETTSQVSTRTARGVTSPGPAENENDRWNQGFSSRSRLRN